MSAYLGTTIAGFPNAFMVTGPNTGLGHSSMIYMIESQLNLMIDSLKRLDAAGASTFEVRKPAQDACNERIQAELDRTVWRADHCKSWYLDKNGKNRILWPEWTYRYRRATRRFNPEEYVVK
jgi:hypothetical protein